MRTPPPPRLSPFFRVWDKAKSEYWSIPNGLVLGLDGSLAFNTRQGLYPIPDTGQAELGRNRWVVEQWTGAKDSVETLIFEGDILRFDVKGITHGPERETGLIGEVWYDPEVAGWSIGHWTEPEYRYTTGRAGDGDTVRPSYSWGYSFGCDRVDFATLTVIGNVHQHSHLLV